MEWDTGCIHLEEQWTWFSKGCPLIPRHVNLGHAVSPLNTGKFCDLNGQFSDRTDFVKSGTSPLSAIQVPCNLLGSISCNQRCYQNIRGFQRWYNIGMAIYHAITNCFREPPWRQSFRVLSVERKEINYPCQGRQSRACLVLNLPFLHKRIGKDAVLLRHIVKVRHLYLWTTMRVSSPLNVKQRIAHLCITLSFSSSGIASCNAFRVLIACLEDIRYRRLELWGRNLWISANEARFENGISHPLCKQLLIWLERICVRPQVLQYILEYVGYTFWTVARTECDGSDKIPRISKNYVTLRKC